MTDAPGLDRLASEAELIEIRPVEIRATHKDLIEADDRLTTPSDDENEAQLMFELSTDAGEAGFRLTLTAKVVGSELDVVIRVRGQYQMDDMTGIEDADLLEFANAVGVPNIFPFLRQEVSNTTMRVQGNPLLLPLIRPGQLVFARQEPEASEAGG